MWSKLGERRPPRILSLGCGRESGDGAAAGEAASAKKKIKKKSRNQLNKGAKSLCCQTCDRIKPKLN